LALASYTQGFVLRNVTAAHELAARSLRLDRGSVLGWLAAGVANNYQGRFADAYDCLMKARDIAGEGPYRHLVDLHAGISAALTGRFAQAISILETVNALTPDFAPPLRYLLATYFKIGENERAEDAIRRLRAHEPNFVMPDLSDPSYPVPALQRSELLDLDKLPLQM
jgi:tetratricopeptide (TPR) repeat protein